MYLPRRLCICCVYEFKIFYKGIEYKILWVAAILCECRLWPSRTGLGTGRLHPRLLGGRLLDVLGCQSWPLEEEDGVAIPVKNMCFIFCLFGMFPHVPVLIL